MRSDTAAIFTSLLARTEHDVRQTLMLIPGAAQQPRGVGRRATRGR